MLFIYPGFFDWALKICLYTPQRLSEAFYWRTKSFILAGDEHCYIESHYARAASLIVIYESALMTFSQSSGELPAVSTGSWINEANDTAHISL